MARSIILFELNEVPFQVLDHAVQSDPYGFLDRATARMRQYRTELTVDYGQLDPWISWPTLHRGVPDGKHGILHLGQNLSRADAEFPPVWQILQENGVSTGVFGSLHSSAVPADYNDYAFYLPDYFATDAVAHPPSLGAFQEFNLAMTRASARNVDRGLGLGAAAGFLARAPQLGATPGTAIAIAQQLAREARAPEAKIRRRNIQPRLMYDLFEHQLDATRPQFATFYTNHVAAAMHRYWAATFEDAPAQMDAGWRKQYCQELPAAMNVFSGILRRLLKWVHAHPDYVVIVAGSMGQGAVEAQTTYEFLTITDGGRFFTEMGLPEGSWKLRPAMVPCVSVDVEPEAREAFRARLAGMAINGVPMIKDHRTFHPLCYDEQDGTFMLYVAMDSYDGPQFAADGERRVSFEDLGLGMMAHEDGVNCTAQHVPEGMLLVYDPRQKFDGSARETLPVLDVAPSLLTNFGIAPPGYMTGSPSLSF